MKKKESSSGILFCLLLLVFSVLIGCGGGGGSAASAPAATISGVAAAGAPIIGTVTLKDSNGVERVSTIAANGSYSINVSELKSPFALRADGYVGGREYHLYSAAVSADINGKINITPFTDLIIANMAEQIAESYYSTGDFSALTPDALAAAEAALRAKLVPILTALGVSESIDLLRTSFNTDHTGLDAVIDVVKVTVDPATVEATLTNVVNGENVTLNIAAGGTSTDSFTGTGVSDGVTALQLITTVWNTFASLFATSLPSPTNATLLSLFADQATFLDNGQDLDTFLTQMTSDNTMVGISVTNIVLQSIDVTNGTAQVTFTPVQNGQAQEGPGICRMIKQSGTWRYAGNGRIAKANVRAEARYWPNNSGTTIQTGLRLEIEANYTAGTAVQSAVVTGPGLPGGGLILNKQISYEWFAVSGGSSNGDNLYAMTDDTMIGAITDNAEYTINLYDTAGGTGNLLATYTDTILKRPLKNSELSSASFPAITAPTVATLRAFNSGSLTVTWTLPTGLASNWLELVLANVDWSLTARVEADNLSATASSQTLVITAPAFTVANRSIYLEAKDSSNRRFQIGIW